MTSSPTRTPKRITRAEAEELLARQRAAGVKRPALRSDECLPGGLSFFARGFGSSGPFWWTPADYLGLLPTTLPPRMACCGGTGVEEGCAECDGTGWVLREAGRIGIACPLCEGTGFRPHSCPCTDTKEEE